MVLAKPIVASEWITGVLAAFGRDCCLEMRQKKRGPENRRLLVQFFVSNPIHLYMERSKLVSAVVFIGVAGLQLMAFQNCAQETGGLQLSSGTTGSTQNRGSCNYFTYSGMPMTLVDGQTFPDFANGRVESAQCPAGQSGNLQKVWNYSKTTRCVGGLLQIVVPESKVPGGPDIGSCTSSTATCQLNARLASNSNTVSSGQSFPVGTQIQWQVVMVTNPMNVSYTSSLTGPDLVAAGNPNGLSMGAINSWFSPPAASAPGAVTRTAQIFAPNSSTGITCSGSYTLTYTQASGSGTSCTLTLTKGAQTLQPGGVIMVSKGENLQWSVRGSPAPLRWQFFGPDIPNGSTGKSDGNPTSAVPEDYITTWVPQSDYTVFERTARVSANGQAPWTNCPGTYLVTYDWGVDVDLGGERWGQNPMLPVAQSDPNVNPGEFYSTLYIQGLRAGGVLSAAAVAGCPSGTTDISFPGGGLIPSPAGVNAIQVNIRHRLNFGASGAAHPGCMMRITDGIRTKEVNVNVPARPAQLTIRN